MKKAFSAILFLLGFASQPPAFANPPAAFHFRLDPPVVHRFASGKPSLSPEEAPPATSQERKGKVSTLKAAGLSVLLPGSGHWYLGERNRAKVFFGMEAAGWGSFAAFLWFSNQREKDYQTYAALHAGANPAGKDEPFWRSLTFYENRDDYNRIGRITNPENPFYPENASYDWQWDSDQSQHRYRLLRNSSKTAQRRAVFTLALLGIERLVAAADAYRISKRINSGSREGGLEVFLTLPLRRPLDSFAHLLR